MDLSDIKKLLDEQAQAFEQFKRRYEANYIDLQARQGRLALNGVISGDESPRDHKALSDALRSFMRGDELALKGMMVSSDPGGGYTVVPGLSDTVTRVVRDFSPIRQIARVVPIDQADAFEELLDKDSAGASWVSETGSRAATDSPTLGKMRIPVHEIYAMPEATQQLIDDSSANILDWLKEKVGEQFGTAEGAAFVSGNGVGKPRGFLDYATAATGDASRAWGVLEHVVTGTSGSFGADPNGADKLIELVHKVKAGYRREAVWLMNKATTGEVRKLKDTAGRFVWVDSLMPGVPSSLLGYPVIEAEDMPAIAANSLSIAFGNFRRGYTIVDRLGLRLLVDPYTNKPYVRLYTYKRVGGDVNDFNAIKLLKFST